MRELISKGTVKLIAAAATAALGGSMLLWRKVSPLKRPRCHYCGSTDIYVLRDGRGMELGHACLECEARYAWDHDAQHFVRLDPPQWEARVAEAEGQA